MKVLVDGYNLLHASGIFGGVRGAGGFEASRRALLDEIARLTGSAAAGVTASAGVTATEGRGASIRQPTITASRRNSDMTMPPAGPRPHHGRISSESRSRQRRFPRNQQTHGQPPQAAERPHSTTAARRDQARWTACSSATSSRSVLRYFTVADGSKLK